ncbi:disease resistance protein At4g27190-like [Macadamia integrifolia]|uniref:disease resistance protein At4g27190-like n=1 Tax=Macadamia integrifolia TaxID=60698 RepID=UPI001C4FE376|nr:disease resistance protein At4g27190-like [Macadamia integrifolia]
MATHTVIPSSSSASGFNCDVVLNYQEEEEETTGNHFASNLYTALERANIKTFKDDDNSKQGEQISEALLKGIKESRCAVILFSRNYASSRRCLEELSLMIECRKKLGQRVIPVFLMGVQGSDVRRQEGCFEEPFRLHQQCFPPEVVERWRSALKIAGELCGFNLKDIPHGDEEKLIKKIVKDVVKDVNPFPKSKKRKRETRPPVIKVPNDAMIENQPSTERMVQQMLEWILNPDPHFGIIGVYGMGGVGKTTLVKEVNNHFEKDLSEGEGIPFEIVIMITVSATPNIPNIQTYISKRLGLPNDSEAEALFDALRKKRFLLILDDVWSKLKLQEIGIPNPRTHKGSKILVTSRSKDACTDMGAKKAIKIHPLSEAESWGLFVEVAGDHVVADEIKCFSERIIGRCKGLPLAIVTVGHAMANRLGVGEWASAVREMELSTTDLRGMKEEVFAPLKFSFDRLENDMLRSLFLYFACFPEDYNIKEYEIVNYCVGEGLVDKYGSLTAARNKGEDLIRSLKIACMVEDGEYKGSVRMHDMMRELALWIVTSSSESDSNGPSFLIRTGELVIETPQAHEWLNATRILFYWTSIEKFPELGGRCQKLTSFLLSHSYISTVFPPTNFLQHMDHLSVLDLSYNKSLSLPDSLSCLVHLRVLRLQGCRDLRSLPALGMLQLLQVLDLNGCEGLEQKIQEYEWVGGLSNLRYLDVANSTVSIPVGVISRLHKLEELRMLKARNIKWRMSSAEDEKWDSSETGREGQKDDHRSIIDVEELSHLTIFNHFIQRYHYFGLFQNFGQQD